jgi:tetratricopeptide (TPR) repeat protein
MMRNPTFNKLVLLLGLYIIGFLLYFYLLYPDTSSLSDIIYYSFGVFFAIYPLFPYPTNIGLLFFQLICPILFFVFVGMSILHINNDKKKVCRIKKKIDQYKNSLTLLLIAIFILLLCSSIYYVLILDLNPSIILAMFWLFYPQSQISSWNHIIIFEIIRLLTTVIIFYIPLFLFLHPYTRGKINKFLLNFHHSSLISLFGVVFLLSILLFRLLLSKYIPDYIGELGIIISLILYFIPIVIIIVIFNLEMKDIASKKLIIEFLRIKKLYTAYFLFFLIAISGFLGFLIYSQETNSNSSETTDLIQYFLDNAYYSLRLFSMNYDSIDNISQDNLFLNFSRVFAALIVVTGLILVFDFFIPDGLIAYLISLSGEHIIICGLGEHGSAIARKKIVKKNLVIVIEKNNNNENISSLREEGALVIIGDANQLNILKKAHVKRAKSIYILTGDDSNNISIINSVREIYDISPNFLILFLGNIKSFFFDYFKNSTKIKCFINIINFELGVGLKNSILDNQEFYSKLDIHIINTSFLASQIFFNKYKSDLGINIGNPQKSNIYIFGSGIIIDYFVIHLVHHFYSLNLNDSHGLNVKLSHLNNVKIRIIDKNAELYKKYLWEKYPNLKNYCTIDISKSIEIWSDGFQKEMAEIKNADLICIFFDDEMLAIETAFSINQLLKCADEDHKHVINYKNIPIYIKISKNKMLNVIFNLNAQNSSHSNLFFFPIIDLIASNSHLFYDLYSGIIEWAAFDLKRTDNKKVLLDSIKGNEILYKYSSKLDRDHPLHKYYPIYLLEKTENFEDKQLREFLNNKENCISDSLFPSFDNFWNLITKKYKISPVDFYGKNSAGLKTSGLIDENGINYPHKFDDFFNNVNLQHLLHDDINWVPDSKIQSTFFENFWNLINSEGKETQADYERKFFDFYLNFKFQSRIIRLFITQGYYQDAEDIITRYDSTILQNVPELLLLKAEILHNNGGKIQELNDLYEEIRKSKKIKNIKKLDGILRIVLANKNSNNPDNYELIIDEFKQIAIENSDSDLKLSIICYNYIGNIFRILNNPKEAIKYYNYVEDFAKKINDLEAISIAYNNLGLVYTVCNKNNDHQYLEKALMYHQKQLEICESINYQKGKQRAWGNSAIIYRIIGDIQKAIENHKKEIETCISIDYSSGLATAYNNIAIIYIFYETVLAQKYLDLQLIIFHKTNNKQGIAQCYGNYALYYFKLGKLEESIRLNEMAIMILKGNTNFTDLIKFRENYSNHMIPSKEHFSEILRSTIDKYMNIYDFIRAIPLAEIEDENNSDIIREKAVQLIEYDWNILFEGKKYCPELSKNLINKSYEEIDGKYEDIIKKALENKKIYSNELLKNLNEVSKPTQETLNVFDDTMPARITTWGELF